MTRLRLATYNMRKAVGLDRRRDPGRVIEVINGLAADVVVLQEADRRLGARPAALPHHALELHTDFTPVHLATNDVSLGFHGNAVLVRRGLAISHPRRIDLPGLEPRGAVAVRVGTSLCVVGVHLGLMRQSRRAQLAHLVDMLRDEPLPRAILGDFNEWSPEHGLEALASGYDVHAPGRSFHAARPIAALDRVALSHGLALQDAGVVGHGHARKASDHLPVWADIRLPPGPQEGSATRAPVDQSNPARDQHQRTDQRQIHRLTEQAPAQENAEDRRQEGE